MGLAREVMRVVASEPSNGQVVTHHRLSRPARPQPAASSGCAGFGTARSVCDGLSWEQGTPG